MASSSSSGSADNIEISDVTIKAPSVITLINLSIKDTLFQRNFDLAKNKSKEAILSLTPERPSLSASRTLTVTVHTRGLFNGSKKIKIKHQDLLSSIARFATVNADSNKQEYRTTVNGIELVAGFSLPQPQPQTSIEAHVTEVGTDLRPTTDKIFDICPRFRVLVIGRTGAGKTSLIKNTFGVTESHISHSEVGECDINKELHSVKENKRFVLHDSKGFEPGDEDNFETVMKFLNDRKDKKEIKDQVHAVWLCFSIPIAGDRLFETGSETFLRLLSDGKLGMMPIIAIFTKYDRLVDHLDFSHASDDAGLSEADARAAKAARVKAKLHELCVQPFREQIGVKSNIPDIFVSTEGDYKWTLHDLTRRTTELVGKYLTNDVALLSAVAQQVSPSLKIDAIIDVGKQRYWKGLASVISLHGNQTEVVLQNIHEDIIRIYNLQDPKRLLDSDEFKKLVAGLVSDQDIPIMADAAKSLTMLGTLVAILTAAAGPVAPIVLPIAAGIVVGHWTLLLLKQAHIVLQRLMAYIVALTLIMQTVFAITTTSTENVVSRRLVKVALKSFIDSSQRRDVISGIKQHLDRPGAFLGRDAALQKITELIESNRISPEGMAEIKEAMQGFDIRKDEPWY